MITLILVAVIVQCQEDGDAIRQEKLRPMKHWELLKRIYPQITIILVVVEEAEQRFQHDLNRSRE